MRIAKGIIVATMHRDKRHKADFLVLGSGIAGMRAAIELAPAGHVLVLSKGPLYESSTEYAQGGIAAALGEDDEVHLHFHDTIVAGDGLCREDAVRVLVEEGPQQIHQLIEWGMRFDREGTKLAFTREGAHSRSRVLHARGDSTGSEILRALMAKAKTLPSIQIQPHAFAADFLYQGDKVAGVAYLDEKTLELRRAHADAVLLATGGLGQVYKETTNPEMACGDGMAMAFRAGALLSDMEFIQFHPTALAVKGAPRFLLSEAVRGEGACLRNILLERFMPRYHEMSDLAPRDVVSRAIVMEMQKTESPFVYLDLTGLDAERTKKRFPRIYETCLRYNIDITTDLVPVRPAAHYSMGGVWTDLYGITTLRGVFAAGEVASTGVHGANRLASNSLLEGLVFGARAAVAILKHCSPSVPSAPPAQPVRAAAGASAGGGNSRQYAPGADLKKLADQVRSIMWEKVGIIRNGKDLREAVERLEGLTCPTPATQTREYYETQNIVEMARAIARSALARNESRGAQYRSDFPLKDEKTPARHSFTSKDKPVHFK